ncbi:hypothetical protein MDOR_29450 [Mycolicibacterium doricum]|uniref:Uncharacterized protein n=1 Tax=Mycolicibacterium doricum TaxID=126673 RepID=A0A7I7VU04_9MYCO|nr:hypothetical protein MDOR_29450 [Mycolicibacterium doricum]
MWRLVDHRGDAKHLPGVSAARALHPAKAKPLGWPTCPVTASGAAPQRITNARGTASAVFPDPPTNPYRHSTEMRLAHVGQSWHECPVR